MSVVFLQGSAERRNKKEKKRDWERRGNWTRLDLGLDNILLQRILYCFYVFLDII